MTPRITYHPIGRLGNAMFQAAACIGYAKKHNVPWGAPRNTREVPNFHSFFPGLPICEDQYRNHNEHPDAYCSVHACHKDLCHFNYHDIPFHPQGVRLMGFFQSWRYFENAQEEVKAAFKLPRVEGYEDAVSIHVRRGDYVQHAGSFPPVTVHYIAEAMDRYWPRNKKQRVIVFSDDIEWCKVNLGNIFCCEFSEGRNEFEDLCLMASCGHHIIANSTFSWWAAYLGHNPDRIVVSPSHKRGNWFGMEAGVKQDCVDLLPPSWTQIEFR